MGAISILPLPYRIDGCDYFAQLRPLAGAVFLDSARVHGAGGRYDLMSALPVCELRTHGAITRITRRGTSVLSAADPFELVAQALAAELPRAEPPGGDWPFAGGAMGWFGYDLGRRMARLAPRDPPPQVADMQIGIYGWALLQDHERRESVALFTEAVDATLRRRLIDRLLAPPEPAPAPLQLESPFCANFDPLTYAAAFARVQRYIRDGDCYQVNLAQRLSARARGDPWSAYLQLRARMASPYSAFLSGDSASVLSFSPERFLH
nr:chorismate-binding protein [Steroidobacteraceae bacterium]